MDAVRQPHSRSRVAVCHRMEFCCLYCLCNKFAALAKPYSTETLYNSINKLYNYQVGLTILSGRLTGYNIIDCYNV